MSRVVEHLQSIFVAPKGFLDFNFKIYQLCQSQRLYEKVHTKTKAGEMIFEMEKVGKSAAFCAFAFWATFVLRLGLSWENH